MELLLMLYSPATIVEEKKRLDQCASTTNTNAFYNTMISNTASFIAENPDYYKVIEMCVATAGVSDDAALKEMELLKAARELIDDKLYVEMCVETAGISDYAALQVTKLLKIVGKFIDNKEYEKAIKICVEILKINPLDGAVYAMLGCCFSYLRRYGEANKIVEKNLEIIFLVFKLWLPGNILRRQRRYEEAIDKFKEATELIPEFYAAYRVWGDCLSALCRYDEAEQKYLKAIEINPKYEDVYFAWGRSLMNQRRYDDAIDLYKRLLKINRRSEEAYKAWAAALMESKEYDKAIRIYEGRLANNKDCMIIYSYGKVLFELKRYKEALVQFQKLMDLHFNNLTFYLDYGHALEKTGRKEAALIVYLTYLLVGSSKLLIDLNFQGIFHKYISPLIGVLRPEGYLKQFYAQVDEGKFSKPVLATLLLMLGKYDVINEQVADIITGCNSKDEKERQGVDLFIFTIKFCIWLKLSEGKVYEALRALELFIQRVKLLQSTGEKEKEVSDLILSLFKLQIHTKVAAGGIREALNAIRAGGVPFNEVFIKVWTCISEPDSVDSQKYLNEKAIGEIVAFLKETAKPTAFV